MKISKHDVQSVAISVGIGFTDSPAVRKWMIANGWRTYEDYARANVGRDRAAVQAELESFAFAA